MALRRVAGSCDDGDCPAVYRDEVSGDVLVQGYLTSVRPESGLPDGEGVLAIPAAAWDRLVRQLTDR